MLRGVQWSAVQFGRRLMGGAVALALPFVLGFFIFLLAIAPRASQHVDLAQTFAPSSELHALQPTLLSPPPADAIVVLTGGGARIDEAVRLFKEGHARRLLISGVNRQTSREDLKRRLAIDPVLFDCCVDIGYIARDTIGNADETQAWCSTWQFDRIILVTANYHMPRSRLEFSRVLSNTHVVGHPVTPPLFAVEGWWHNPQALAVAGHEYIKLVSALVRMAGSRMVNAAVANARPSGVPVLRQDPSGRGEHALNEVGKGASRL